jgi:hypothetical protein
MARYSVSRKKRTEIYTCLQCPKQFGYSSGTTNKFCSIPCNVAYKWEKESIPRVEQGLGGIRIILKYLKEKRGDKCEVCGQGNIHNGKPLVLQCDHIDGNSDNNSLSNVRLICPNCHTQTSNFGSKGIGNRYRKITKRNKYLQEYKNSVP